MIQPLFLRMRMARLVLSASICAVPQGAWAQNRVEPHLQHLFETAEAHNASLQSLEAASREAQAAVETAKAERVAGCFGAGIVLLLWQRPPVEPSFR